MATTAQTLGITRPYVPTYDANGVPNGYTEADYLLVRLDRWTDGTSTAVHRILFSDYAGLETEWEAQSAVTVLEAAIESELSSVDWLTTHMNATQRALIDTPLSES